MSRAARTHSKKYQHLYRLKAYREGRKAFLAANPWCLVCAIAGLRTPSDTVNHKIPHKGDRALFLDKRNWQPVCAPCHNTACQHQDRTGSLPLIYGADGWPVNGTRAKSWEERHGGGGR